MNNKDFTYLVNKDHTLPANFVPDDIVTIEFENEEIEKLANFGSKSMISKSILPYFDKMAEDAKKDGFVMLIDSGYRSYKRHQEIWDMFIAKVGLEETKNTSALTKNNSQQK